MNVTHQSCAVFVIVFAITTSSHAECVLRGVGESGQELNTLLIWIETKKTILQCACVGVSAREPVYSCVVCGCWSDVWANSAQVRPIATTQPDSTVQTAWHLTPAAAPCTL